MEAAAAPLFRSRLNFSMMDSELAGEHLEWLDCTEICGHLLIAFAIPGAPPHLAFVVLNADWNIAAVLKIPVVLDLVDGSSDSVDIIQNGILCKVRECKDSAEILCCITQAWHRSYPLDPANLRGHGSGLGTWDASWYRIKCQFFATIPILSSTCDHVARERCKLAFLRVGGRGYWLSSARQLPLCEAGRAYPLGMVNAIKTPLEIAEAYASGLPSCWALLHGAETEEDASDRMGIFDARAYDDAHMLLLLSKRSRLYLALLRLDDRQILRHWLIAVPSAAGHLSWSCAESAGGTIWFSADNGKLSAAKRDKSLWRVDYSGRLATAKRASDAIKVTRLSEDRVVTSKSVLDYNSLALVMWQDGMNIKKPNMQRCILFRRTVGESSTEAGQKIPKWMAHNSEGFLDTLPMSDPFEGYWMGKPVDIAETEQYPFKAFMFNGQPCAAVRLWHYKPLGSELILGEVNGVKNQD